MNLTRTASAALRTIVFTAWSLAMTVVGLWLIWGKPLDLPMLRPVFLSLGVMSVAGGQVLFMFMVADRLFPRASPRVVGMLEICCLSAFLAGATSFIWIYSAGG